MRRIATTGLVLLALAGLGLGLALWRGEEPGGIDDLYIALFGRPDLGDVDFATLERRSSPNDALACPPGVCPKARADIEPPVFPVAGEQLRRIVLEVAQSEPNTQLVYSSRWGEQDRYVARTTLMRFPDTISVMIVGEGEGRSTLAIYSRSQIGYGDLGVNQARVGRWLRKIGERARGG